MRVKLILLIFFLTFGLLNSQTLKNESIQSNIYLLNIQNNINYSLQENNGIKNIVFDNYLDESSPGTFTLPAMDLFVSIPPNSKPKLEIINENKEIIDAIPLVNPMVEKVNDSTLVYNQTELKSFSDYKFRVLGNLNIDNYYCVHIKYFPYRYNVNNGKVEKINNFTIKLTFDHSVESYLSKEPITHPLILNPSFAINNNNYNTNKPLAESWIDFNKTYVKVGVIKDDLYRITKSDLENLAVNTNAINPKTFKMYVKGAQIPIYVYGENDYSFDQNDYIEFVGIRNYGDANYREAAAYGQPYKEYLNRYSDTTAYFLTWDGDEGLRTDTVTNYSGTPSTTIDFYDEFLHIEQNPWFDYSLDGGTLRREDPDWHENETWNWWGQGVGTVSQSFTVSNLYPNRIARGFAKFQSWGTNLTTNAHLTALKINNYPTTYDSGYVNKYQVKTLKAEFSSNLLVNGTNNLRIVSYPTTATINTLFGDWREIEYPRYLLARNDTLTFRYTSLPDSGMFGTFSLGNVITNNNIIYKYIGNYKFIKITNFNKNGNIISFIDSVKNKQWYILRTTNTIKKPIFYYKKQYQDLLNPQNSAHYVVLTHPLFLQKANEYATFISQNYNLTTKVINVFDIYDQLNYGFFAPEPIKEFLKTAYNTWQPTKLDYVFIVGRANYDYYGNKTKYQGAPIERCFVPSFGAPVSDNWFVIWDSTQANIPVIKIGRLPARNLAEFESYFAKHQNYINNPFDNWNKRFLFFSGGNFTDPNQISTLKSINDFIINNYVKLRPVGGDATHFYKTVNPITNFGPYSPAFIQDKIEKGSLVISYLGHSGTQTWDNSITDPIQLRNNVNRSPLITDFGCSTARFAEPDITSFSELFVNGLSGQAIAYIGNSSLGFTSTSYTAPKLFYEKLLKDTVLTLGDAHRFTKIKLLSTYGSTGTYRLFSLTNTLVGDPIVKLKLPNKPNLLITNSDFATVGELSDATDSVLCKFNFFNSGLATVDSFKINIKHTYNSQTLQDITLNKVLPLFADSVSFYLKTKNLTGLHNITISLDFENTLNELYENDNNLNINLNVYSSSFRNLHPSNNFNFVKNPISFLNSNQKSNSSKLLAKISYNPSFINADSLLVPISNLLTKIDLNNYSPQKRIWLKVKPEFGIEYGTPISFYLSNLDKFGLNDSLSFDFEYAKNISYNGTNVKIDSLNINIYALSAGYNAGRTAIIAINGQNLIPENTLRGFHVCRFNKSDLSFIEYKLFDVSPGTTANNIFISYLDGISNNEIVAIAVADDAGQGLTTATRNKLKEFGSRLIDNFGYRQSWAIIGYKGAPIGSVPEGLKGAFDGKVEIDTNFARMPQSGAFVTKTIGPAANWKDFSVTHSIPQDASIRYQIIGVKNNNTVDTLNIVEIDENGNGNLNFVDAKVYPKIKIKGAFNTVPGIQSPTLRAIEIGYDKFPELATNYQLVTASADTIMQGASISFNYGFMNVGGSPADSFRVVANLILPSKNKRVILDSLFTSLDTMQLKTFSYTYVSNFDDGFGDMAFELIIDSTNKVKEYFKDNNYFKLPFYVIKDTVTNVYSAKVSATFDGMDIADGDFVSNKPVISINLDYMPLFPYKDTSSFRLYLDGIRKYHNQLDSSVYDTVNRKLTFFFKPDLSDGDHYLRITGNNIVGNLAGYNGYQKSFSVSSLAKVLYVYNYPNPFTNYTYFTFKLTQIPDELNIYIYTIAGRLIKKLKVNIAELNIDFNKVYWDGKDEDGNEIGNGVYFYKMIMKSNNKTESITQKFAKVK